MQISLFDLSQALRIVQASDEDLAQAHCSLAELEAYHRRGLSAREHEGVADHLALCENCSALLLYAVIAPDHQGDSNLGKVDPQVGIAWRRFCDRLSPTEPDLEVEIDRCYEEIIALSEGPRLPNLEGKIERAFLRLRKLQGSEAARFRRQFENQLAMPIDAGARIIARAGALREKLEDLVASDAPSRRAYPP